MAVSILLFKKPKYRYFREKNAKKSGHKGSSFCSIHCQLQACKSGTPKRLRKKHLDRFWKGISKQEQILPGTSESNKRDDGIEPPELRSLATSRKEVENDCFIGNQTAIAEERIRNEGMNKFTAQPEPTASLSDKDEWESYKRLCPKRRPSSVHSMSGREFI